MGGQSVEDMERVIAAMRRVVERLQIENDNLKKHPVSGQPQTSEITKENKRLKVGLSLYCGLSFIFGLTINVRVMHCALVFVYIFFKLLRECVSKMFWDIFFV